MEWIKRRTFEYSLRRARKRKDPRDRKGRLRGESFLLLYTSDSETIPKPIKRFLHRLRQDGKTVQCVQYMPNVKQASSDQSVLRLSKKDSTWYGKPRAESVQDVLHTPRDVLICLDENISRIFRYIIALSRVQFKVGVSTADMDELDLKVDIESNCSLEKRLNEIEEVLRTVSTVLDRV